MPIMSLDPELRSKLCHDALEALDRMVSVAPPDDTISYREIGAQIYMIRTFCHCREAVCGRRR